MAKKTPPSRNYLLLGASLLIAGLLVELLSEKVMQLSMSVIYKTLIIMFMIAIGYSFAESFIFPFAKGSLKIMQKPFTGIAGTNLGKVLFYITIYGALFGLYLLIFIYGMRL